MSAPLLSPDPAWSCRAHVGHPRMQVSEQVTSVGGAAGCGTLCGDPGSELSISSRSPPCNSAVTVPRPAPPAHLTCQSEPPAPVNHAPAPPPHLAPSRPTAQTPRPVWHPRALFPHAMPIQVVHERGACLHPSPACQQAGEQARPWTQSPFSPAGRGTDFWGSGQREGRLTGCACARALVREEGTKQPPWGGQGAGRVWAFPMVGEAGCPLGQMPAEEDPQLRAPWAAAGMGAF